MKWDKLGLVFCPDNQYDWMVSHAANPVARHQGGDRFRVYFSCRDRRNRSSVGFVELDLKEPQRILELSNSPVLSPGELGTFDDSGASIGCLVADNEGKDWLYYLGWNLGKTVPWYNNIGMARWNAAQETFERWAPAPVVGRNAIDPLSVSYPWVLRDADRWQMWYGSNLKWGPAPFEMEFEYSIKYAESANGIDWHREGLLCLEFHGPQEHAIARPCVIKQADKYQMWYSYRGKTYRIGYAESPDGVHWDRQDDRAGITVSPSGWDSQSVEYACVFDHADRRYMLYNGNGYGQSGFGLAILAQD